MKLSKEYKGESDFFEKLKSKHKWDRSPGGLYSKYLKLKNANANSNTNTDINGNNNTSEKDDSFDEWLKSVDLISYKARLIEVGIESKLAFGGFVSKTDLIDLVKENIELDKVGHIGLFGAAYDSITTESGM